MDYIAFLEKQNTLFKKGSERVGRYRNQWHDFAVLVKDTYKPLAEKAAKFEFDCLYLKENKDYPGGTTSSNRNFVLFFMANHPNGISTTTHGQGQFVSHESSVEHGGQLVFSQGPQGEVLVIMYPCSSKEMKFKDEYIV